MAHKRRQRKTSSRYDNISAIVVPIKQRRARTDGAIRRLHGLE
jgi:hypothetical protein